MSLPKVPKRTTPGVAFSTLNRALFNCLGRRRFGRAEMDEVLDFFGMSADTARCVYCGSSDVRRWDHVVPLVNGGETVLGNMVPACGHCDDSKRDLALNDFVSTLLKNASGSGERRDIQTRAEHVRRYAQHFRYVACQPEERLDAEELNRLEVIRRRSDELKREVYQLVESYRKRTGNA